MAGDLNETSRKPSSSIMSSGKNTTTSSSSGTGSSGGDDLPNHPTYIAPQWLVYRPWHMCLSKIKSKAISKTA
eukprot:scaffold25685_cov127-Cylindrotheca_fusiformis.AAC.6